MRSHEVVYLNTKELLASVLKSIDSAKEEILIESYIFDEGELSKTLFAKLIEAQKRGVIVKITVDAAGAYGDTQTLRELCTTNNFDLKIYHPIFWTDLISNFEFANRRNHRKMFIFDSKLAYVSSVNITDSHIKKNEEGFTWKDYGISIDGPAVEKLIAAFKRCREKVRIKNRWSKILKGFDHNTPEQGLLLNDTLLKRNEWKKLLQQRIQNATKRIWIASPYILPEYKIQKYFEAASKRGVDVKILTSGSSTSDVFFMPWITSLFYKLSLKIGIEIYEYLPSFFHGKVLVIDDYVSIGSSNMNHRSIFLDLEVEIEVLRQDNKEKVVEDLKKCLSESKCITQENVKDIPLWQLCIARVLYLFKYWL